MRFWIPVLGSLFAAFYILRFSPSSCGMMTVLVAYLTGLDIGEHLRS